MDKNKKDIELSKEEEKSIIEEPVIEEIPVEPISVPEEPHTVIIDGADTR